MAKRVKNPRRLQKKQRKTNWTLIGGIVALGIIVLGVLLFIGMQEPEPTTLEAYCQANPGNCIVKGPVAAPVTLIEVSDYGCPACRFFHQQTAGQIEQVYVEPGQVRYVVLPYALRTETVLSAAAAFCAVEQDNFFAYHDAVFDLQESPLGLGRQGLLQVAGQVGMDVEAFASCLDAGTYEQAVRNNVQAASAAGVRATPSFFINNFMLEGAQPFPVFQQRIESLLSF